MNKHNLRLMGGAKDEVRVSAATLQEAVGAFLKGAAQAVRVTATLDTISASRADLVLVLHDGTRIPARMATRDNDTLKKLFGQRVVVSGMAHYRSSGRLLKLDVEFIAATSESDSVFEAAPVALGNVPVVQIATQDASSGVSAFFGTWPGDESEVELLEALRSIE